MSVGLSSVALRIFFSVFSLYIRAWREKKKVKERGKILWLWEENGAGKCLIQWREAMLEIKWDWLVLGWQRTYRTGPGDDLMPGIEDKTEKSVVRPLRMGEGLLVRNKFTTLCTSQWLLSVTSQSCHSLSLWLLDWVVEALNMHGMIDCEIYDSSLYLKLWHDSLRWIEEDCSDVSKSKSLRHKYFIGWMNSCRWQA